MSNILMQLGVGGIFAVLIIKEFVNLVIKMKEKKSGNGNGVAKEKIKDIKDIVIDTNQKSNKLFDMHNHFDNDGVPLFQIPRSLENKQNVIVEEIRETVTLMKKVSDTQEALVNTQKEISITLIKMETKLG